MNEPEEIDDETLASFEKVANTFRTRKPEAFKEWFHDLIPSPSSPPVSPSNEQNPMLTYFQKRAEKLEEMIEEFRSVLTPEQLIQIKSARNAAKSVAQSVDAGGAPNGARPTNNAEPAPKPKKRTWL